MTGKRKRKRRRHSRHPIPDYKRAVLAPVRCAVMALIEPRVNGGQRLECPRIGEVISWLSGGRATKYLVRHWLNGTRRAPVWFIDVLRGELARQIQHRQDIDAKLIELRAVAGDRRRGPLASARMRAHWLAGDPAFHTGKRLHSAANEDSAPKNDPHN